MPISHRTQVSRRSFLKHTVAVAAVVPLLQREAFAASRKVNVYNWDTYIGPTTLEDFTKASGIEVRYDLFADNGELFARLRDGNPGYDVIVPASDTLERMIKSDMVLPLDHKKIPNLSNLEERFLKAPYDMDRKYSACYFWGTWGVGYRKKATEKALGGKPLDSWRYVLGPDNGAFKGRISWMSDPVTIIGSGLKMNGFAFNSTNKDELAKTVEMLIAAKAHIRTIAGDNGQDMLLAKEVDAAVDANGDIVQVMAEDSDIAYVCPKEGVQLWEDSLAIAKGCPDIAEAHEFINYILTPEVHADIAKTVGYALPNAAAKKLMPADYLSNPAIFPPEEVIKVSEYARYQGEEMARFYTDAMIRIRGE